MFGDGSEKSRALVGIPPAPLPAPDGRPVVFLAGSIDGGDASDWQARVIAALSDRDLVLLNPRRAAWDESWSNAAASPAFRQQVEWELAGLDRADVIAMYLAPESKAPISLLELGLHAGSGKIVLCCPDGFWRKGNVDIVAERYGIPRVFDLDGLIALLATMERRASG